MKNEFSATHINKKYNISRQTLYNYKNEMTSQEKKKYLINDSPMLFNQKGLDFVLDRFGYQDHDNQIEQKIIDENESLKNEIKELKKLNNNQLTDFQATISTMLNNHNKQLETAHKLLENQQVLSLQKIEEIKQLEDENHNNSKGFFKRLFNK